MKPAILEIIDATAREFGVSPEKLIGAGRRTSRMVEIRSVAAHISRAVFGHTLGDIRKVFGFKANQTIYNAQARARKLFDNDAEDFESASFVCGLVASPDEDPEDLDERLREPSRCTRRRTAFGPGHVAPRHTPAWFKENEMRFQSFIAASRRQYQQSAANS